MPRDLWWHFGLGSGANYSPLLPRDHFSGVGMTEFIKTFLVGLSYYLSALQPSGAYMMSETQNLREPAAK